MPSNGFEFGTGFATAVVAIGLVLLSVAGVWPKWSSTVRRASIGLSVIEFIVVSVHLVRVHVLSEYLVYGPGIGVIAVTAGAAIALGGAGLIRPRAGGRKDHP